MSKQMQKKLHPEVVDLIPRPVYYPDENPLDYEALYEALKDELAPGTPYEKILVANQALLEWDGFRHRRLRDKLVVQAASSIRTPQTLARAYASEITTIVVHDDRLEEIKNRRRRLREEFERLKALRKRRSESATVIDA